MKRLLFLGVLLILLSSTAAFAWTEYYDGSALPTFVDPWWEDNNGGSVSVGSGIITCSSGSGWYEAGISCGGENSLPGIPTMVVGSRFKVNSMGGSGLSLILTSVGADQPSAPLGIGVIANGHLALTNFAGVPGEGTNQPITLVDLGAVDSAWHTAYLLSGASGVWQACVDGELYSGVMDTNDWSEAVGYASFAADSYWANTRAISTSFDWFAYGDETNMVIPEPGSLVALGCGLIGLLGAIRRRR